MVSKWSKWCRVWCFSSRTCVVLSVVMIREQQREIALTAYERVSVCHESPRHARRGQGRSTMNEDLSIS